MQSLIQTVNQMLTTADDPPLTSAVRSGEVEELRAWLARKVDQWPGLRSPFRASTGRQRAR
jgi:hypothetical protein